MRADERGRVVIDRTGDEDQALFQEARENIKGALASAGLLDNCRDQIHISRARIKHGITFRRIALPRIWQRLLYLSIRDMMQGVDRG